MQPCRIAPTHQRVVAGDVTPLILGCICIESTPAIARLRDAATASSEIAIRRDPASISVSPTTGSEDTRNTSPAVQISIRPKLQERSQTPIKASTKQFTGGNNTVCKRSFSSCIRPSGLGAFAQKRAPEAGLRKSLTTRKGFGRSSRI